MWEKVSKIPSQWIKEAQKVLNTQSFIGLSVYVKHDLSCGVVSPDFVMMFKALFSTGFKNKEKKHTPS